MSRPKPYIGVSGVVSPDIQHSIEHLAEQAHIFDAGRFIALGVKAVHKTQFLDIPNKYGPDWYPVGEASFTSALQAPLHPQTIGVAQAYFDIGNVHERAYRESFLESILHRGQPWLNAIQFDMLPWHDNFGMLGFIEDLKIQHPHIAIIMQCHKNAMSDLGPKGVACRLGSFACCVDYLLFDASHGTGTTLEPDSLKPFIEEAYCASNLDSTSFGIAGGLDEQTVREQLPYIIQEYKNVSWDAEGKLHPVSNDGTRPLSLGATKGYLEASAAVLHSN